jgi:hypothetical protein
VSCMDHTTPRCSMGKADVRLETGRKPRLGSRAAADEGRLSGLREALTNRRPLNPADFDPLLGHGNDRAEA